MGPMVMILIARRGILMEATAMDKLLALSVSLFLFLSTAALAQESAEINEQI